MPTVEAKEIWHLKNKKQRLKHLTCTISLTKLKPPGPIIDPARR